MYDTPTTVRTEILRRVRQQLGAAQYLELLEAVGEEGILRPALQAGGAGGSPVRDNIWGRALKSPVYQLPAFNCFSASALLYIALDLWRMVWFPGLEVPDGVGRFGLILLAAVRIGCFMTFAAMVRWIAQSPSFETGLQNAIAVGKVSRVLPRRKPPYALVIIERRGKVL